MATELDKRCRALVAELGLGMPGDVEEVVPLTGGVASDIAMLRVGERQICAKFALPKLKVSADWFAPVHRNAAEYAWLKVAADVSPESAVQLFGRSETQHGFAMEYLAGDDVYLWKTALLDEVPDQGEAARVADTVGRIHAVSARSRFDRAPFQNSDDFHALRIDPYLKYTAGLHPGLAQQIGALADMLYDNRQVLVHGDVSPKNILFRAGRPILLDAECASMGDASFDPSFCLNHLVLKAAHLPGSRGRLLEDVGVFWKSYEPHVGWEPAGDLEARICRLVPALMLARVDGKSPVEYLREPVKAKIRQTAIDLLKNPSDHLDHFSSRLAKEFKDI
ncbi:phosphotransferase family protein [Roseibium sp.]|uniref:phosphotransferase family protein n=1 Tax=Roseibium sp. TaxID=1936156 RepID=UPI003BAB19FB